MFHSKEGGHSVKMVVVVNLLGKKDVVKYGGGTIWWLYMCHISTKSKSAGK